MCNSCGCNITPGNHALALRPLPVATNAVEVLTHLLGANDRTAAHNREHFHAHGVLAVNLMSSPGSGKTALLEATIEALRGRCRIGVIEGDLETENDALRIRRHGVPAVQITTGSACHLDAHMIHDALHGMPLEELDILFIENVGNLVCPASFDLGQHRNVVLLSMAEGDDKPAKYPVMFRAADLVLLSKADLAACFDDFDAARAERHIRHLANAAPVAPVSVKQTDGLEPWLDWLTAQIENLQAGAARQANRPEDHDHAHRARLAR